MKSKLRANERCPLHKSYFCCGRENRRKLKRVAFAAGPVTRVEDPHHPRGYRELCTPAELRRRKHVLIAKDPSCWLCGERFTEYSEIELEHREPKGMNGAFRDDHWNNLALAHKICNSEKGSKRIALPPEENKIGECAESGECTQNS